MLGNACVVCALGTRSPSHLHSCSRHNLPPRPCSCPACSALEQQRRDTGTADVSDALAAAAAAAAQRQQQQRINFHVGVLHYTPSSEPFPLLDDAVEVRLGVEGALLLWAGRHLWMQEMAGAGRRYRLNSCRMPGPSRTARQRPHPSPSLLPPAPPPQYNPSTININSDPAEMAYWIGILQARLALDAG